ncbi:acetyltransferase [Clostridium beijerinckii]|uniref:UDP-perosamine 4-acetyltransferase n=1 Tax=Clostridium beijerinckii TaxID=1520 RepID=A0AAX0AZI6_CLOBE|nr:acetyltransferase [Clostridium beijerinckii]NRT35117.1 UDP-perosamine 4-acetyltransferase [Clostridium beijerinckii]NRT45453.1 UDP-perosamine 4-acetyltransferase [Clostridium beijerinckii]NRT87533.1 UDP-perosamine 4-acetyltransferase [Clostridium beijerinckii]NRZ20549.1 UDP-perosamine 4-acetyltransferase [Clostridium beijerinckii]NYC72963.1 UDP-perosamine 4-acetyltransferase [Clostridium beijerinckii]
MERIILVGGGGHCKSIIDSISGLKEFKIVGIVDKKISKDMGLGIDVIGTDENLGELYKSGIKNAFISVGSVGNPCIRIKLYNILKDIGYNFPKIIDKTAIVSESALINDGVFVGKGAIINAKVTIEKQCIINSGTIVEHDCNISEFVHLAPGVTLSGGVNIGKRTHVGTNATIIQNVTIGNDVIIGAGSVIIKDIKNGLKVYGNPGKEAHVHE